MRHFVALRVLALGVAGLIGVFASAQLHVVPKPLTPQEKDNIFLKFASDTGLAEVQYGKLGVERGYSPDVKAFGQKVVDTYAALNEKVRPLVAAHEVTTLGRLSGPEQVEYDKLMGLSGVDFDREFLKLMVMYQSNDLHQFRRAAAMTVDSDLKVFATDATKQLFRNSLEANHLARVNGVELPGPPGSEPSAVRP